MRMQRPQRLSLIWAKASLMRSGVFPSTTSMRFSPIMASPTFTPASARIVLGRLAVETICFSTLPPLNGPPAMTSGTRSAASWPERL